MQYGISLSEFVPKNTNKSWWTCITLNNCTSYPNYYCGRALTKTWYGHLQLLWWNILTENRYPCIYSLQYSGEAAHSQRPIDQAHLATWLLAMTVMVVQDPWHHLVTMSYQRNSHKLSTPKHRSHWTKHQLNIYFSYLSTMIWRHRLYY